MKKRIFSRVLALFMALSMLTTTVFAASFDDLQEAIDGTGEQTTATEVVKADPVPQEPETSETPADQDTPEEPESPTIPERTPDSDETHKNGALVRQETLEDGTTQNYFGYGWSSVTENENTTWYYAIEAHDEQGNRFVVLLDDVSKGNGTASGVVIGQDGSKTDVTIDMNGHSITGEKDSTVITVNKDAELNLNNGTISGGQIGIDVFGTLFLDTVTVAGNSTGININKDGKVTFKGDKNVVKDNDKNLVGEGLVDFTLTVGEKEKHYQVDAATAEKLLAATITTVEGKNYQLATTADGEKIVLYTGDGETLSQGIVNGILNKDANGATGFLIPEGVKTIGTSAFMRRSTLKTANIPSTVTTIEQRAFESCSNWEGKIENADKWTTVGYAAFFGCGKVTGELNFEVLTGLSNRAFYGCSGLTKLSFGKECSLTSIPAEAFNGCAGLTGNVEIPATVTSIGGHAFRDCSRLERIKLPEAVETIGERAFWRCSRLESLNIPSKVTIIAAHAFAGCSNWEGKIENAEKWTTVGEYAFADCKKVTGELNFNALTEQSLGFRAFANCSGLTKLSFGEGCTLTSIPSQAFTGCSGLTGDVKLPDNVTSIGSDAFSGCSRLKEITLPEKVEKIGQRAFRSCTSLATITIPTSVTEVGDNVLANSGVKSVWVYPDAENNGEITVAALLPKVSDRNVFVVGNDEAKLYRNGNTVDFGELEKDNFVIREDGKVDVTNITNLTITSSDEKTTKVQLGDAASMSVTTGGSLNIPNAQVTITDADNNNWAIDGDVTISKDGSKTEVSGGTVTAPNGSAITASDGATMTVQGGKITAKGEVTYTAGEDSEPVIITGNGVVVDPTEGTVTVPGNGGVKDGNGVTTYPNGATMKEGQIVSKGDVAFENESGSKIVVKPAKEGEPVTVDTATGTITVPNGGSVTMGEGEDTVTVTCPDGATADRQGSVTSNGDVVYVYDNKEVTVTAPEGKAIEVDSDGTITVPEGGTIDGVEYPYGATIRPNGDIVDLTPPVVLPDFTFNSDTAGTGDGDDTTTIADDEVPLAGLISNAQLVSYLYAREGSPDGEDAEGEYTLAWAWAVKNEIVDKESDPEEIVTAAILRSVMTRYAKFLDTTFDVEIEGEDDMIVMNCDEILAAFYASLKSKAA